MNRFVWNMRYPDATNVPGAIFWAGSVDGPIAPPGHYQVRLTVGETTQTVPFEIRKDPRVAATQEELDAQFDLLLKIRDQLTRAHNGINQLRDVRSQVESWEKRVEGREDAQPMRDAADGAEEEPRRGRGGTDSGALQGAGGPAQLPDQTEQQTGEPLRRRRQRGHRPDDRKHRPSSTTSPTKSPSISSPSQPSSRPMSRSSTTSSAN